MCYYIDPLEYHASDTCPDSGFYIFSGQGNVLTKKISHYLLTTTIKQTLTCQYITHIPKDTIVESVRLEQDEIEKKFSELTLLQEVIGGECDELHKLGVFVEEIYNRVFMCILFNTRIQTQGPFSELLYDLQEYKVKIAIIRAELHKQMTLISYSIGVLKNMAEQSSSFALLSDVDFDTINSIKRPSYDLPPFDKVASLKKRSYSVENHTCRNHHSQDAHFGRANRPFSIYVPNVGLLVHESLSLQVHSNELDKIIDAASPPSLGELGPPMILKNYLGFSIDMSDAEMYLTHLRSCQNRAWYHESIYSSKQVANLVFWLGLNAPLFNSVLPKFALLTDPCLLKNNVGNLIDWLNHLNWEHDLDLNITPQSWIAEAVITLNKKPAVSWTRFMIPPKVKL